MDYSGTGGIKLTPPALQKFPHSGDEAILGSKGQFKSKKVSILRQVRLKLSSKENKELWKNKRARQVNISDRRAETLRGIPKPHDVIQELLKIKHMNVQGTIKVVELPQNLNPVLRAVQKIHEITERKDGEKELTVPPEKSSRFKVMDDSALKSRAQDDSFIHLKNITQLAETPFCIQQINDAIRESHEEGHINKAQYRELGKEVQSQLKKQLKALPKAMKVDIQKEDEQVRQGHLEKCALIHEMVVVLDEVAPQLLKEKTIQFSKPNRKVLRDLSLWAYERSVSRLKPSPNSLAETSKRLKSSRDAREDLLKPTLEVTSGRPEHYYNNVRKNCKKDHGRLDELVNRLNVARTKQISLEARVKALREEISSLSLSVNASTEKINELTDKRDGTVIPEKKGLLRRNPKRRAAKAYKKDISKQLTLIASHQEGLRTKLKGLEVKLEDKSRQYDSVYSTITRTQERYTDYLDFDLHRPDITEGIPRGTVLETLSDCKSPLTQTSLGRLYKSHDKEPNGKELSAATAIAFTTLKRDGLSEEAALSRLELANRFAQAQGISIEEAVTKAEKFQAHEEEIRLQSEEATKTTNRNTKVSADPDVRVSSISQSTISSVSSIDSFATDEDLYDEYDEFSFMDHLEGLPQETSLLVSHELSILADQDPDLAYELAEEFSNLIQNGEGKDQARDVILAKMPPEYWGTDSSEPVESEEVNTNVNIEWPPLPSEIQDSQSINSDEGIEADFLPPEYENTPYFNTGNLDQTRISSPSDPAVESKFRRSNDSDSGFFEELDDDISSR